MEVEIISSFHVKPSHPTPQHLKIHNLSLLDQFVRRNYVPILLFYIADNGEETLPHKLQLLRQSLSETLTHFYPFAGTIKDRLSIDCNDRGIHYSEAKANSSLIDLFKQPNLLASSLRKLLPSARSIEGDQVAMIQVTTFTCGGLAIGLNESHIIADGSATSFFFNSWGARARKAIDHYVCPNFEAPPAIFPHRADILPEGTGFITLSGVAIETSKIATGRLGFGAGAIAKLKAEGSSSKVPNPSRVEVVSAFIWKCILGALKTDSILTIHAVNMRRKAVPAFPASYMGNCFWVACSSSSSATVSNRAAKEEEKDVGTELLPGLVIKLRKVVNKIDSDFLKSLQGEGGWVKFCEALGEMAEEASGVGAIVRFSSWCGLGFYNVDFGWGKPAWVTWAGFTDAETAYYNTVVLMDIPSGDGIEALVFLQDNDTAILEQDSELLALATLDPSPLQLNSHV